MDTNNCFINMAESSGMWCRNPTMQTVDPNEKLFLFGYSCKIFRDDEKAKYIDQGKHLIPWMGDESLMIDRYDVRGYLHDLKQYEANVGVQIEDPDSDEEKLCDEERYRSLRSDLSEEQLYQEEELKRLRAAIASDGAYHEIGFSYDNEVENFNNEPEGPKEEPEELYEPPPGLNIPRGMEVPYNMKIHAIIEKTAIFVSEQGGQMEIIIKMKQEHNPQFGFMHLDNPLYPYYKFLLNEIKCGSYKPVQNKRVSRSEDEDEDGHYLHPSLLAGKKENVPKFTVPSINFKRSQDDSYSVLVRNLQQQFAEEKLSKEVLKEKEMVPENQQCLVNYSLDESHISNSLSNSYTDPVVPPPDIQPIIQKMAEYVAKNGEDFEYVVKSKNDKRFEFLQPSSEYYAYYIHLRDQSKLRLQPTSEDAMPAPNDDMKSSDGIIPSELKPPTQPTMDEFDALYSHDSQDQVYGPEPQHLEVPMEELSNSVDSVDSIGIPRDSKSKCSKIVKGPISFSLKAKDADSTPTEKLKIPLLLDDSDEESNEEGQKEKVENPKRRRSEESRTAPNSRHESIEREEKPKLTSEMEAKLAEERMKDKLLSAARERLVQQKKERRLEQERQKREEQVKRERQLQAEQQRKEKQLQLERKKKAALFLQMLKNRNPSGDLQTTTNTTDNPENGVLFPLRKIGGLPVTSLPGIQSEWSESSASEESGEEIMITEFCSDPDPVRARACDPGPRREQPPPPPPAKRPPKRKKQRRSRSQDRHRSRRGGSRDRRRPPSRSPPPSSRNNHKHDRSSKKEKELPAAYALANRSRSRSRSPRRYRQNPGYWNRRR